MNTMSQDFAPPLPIQTTSSFNVVKNMAAKQTSIEITAMTVFTIALFAFLYMVISSIGMKIYAKCESMKGKPIQENLNKFLAATITIAITIPFTLLISKVAGKNNPKMLTGVFLLIYSIMGLVGSAAVVNWSRKCDNVKKSEKGYAGFSLAIFTLSLLISFYMLRPNKIKTM